MFASSQPELVSAHHSVLNSMSKCNKDLLSEVVLREWSELKSKHVYCIALERYHPSGHKPFVTRRISEHPSSKMIAVPC